MAIETETKAKDVTVLLISAQYGLISSDLEDEGVEDDGTDTNLMSTYHTWELSGMIKMALELGILSEQEIIDLKKQYSSVE